MRIRLPSEGSHAQPSSVPVQPPLTSTPGEPGRFTTDNSPRLPSGARRDTAVPSHSQSLAPAPPAQNRNRTNPRVDIEGLIHEAQRRFPAARIHTTGRMRTVRRQAELMAQRRRANRLQFLRTYRPTQHITEMDNWVAAHPRATERETVDAFETIIRRAVARGAAVSNHLTNRARDISVPAGGREVQTEVRQWFTDQGAHLIDEHDATGGPHWHIDF